MELPLPTFVFVDYEYWRYGLLHTTNAETNIESWFSDVKTKGDIKEIYFFGDFSQHTLIKDIPKIRSITNHIIETVNPQNTKDYTDFIMLDQIYQRVVRADHQEQYIIFSGDGHFHSAVVFIKNFRGHVVGVYGLEHNFNYLLKQAASWYTEIPVAHVLDSDYEEAILKNLAWAEQRPMIIPTFSKTVESISERSGLDKRKLADMLSEMIKRRYITQLTMSVPGGKEIRALKVNWDFIKLKNSTKFVKGGADDVLM